MLTIKTRRKAGFFVMFTIVYYQAETGWAMPEGFQEVLVTIRQATRN
jgi:hypothetical protein